MPIKDAVHHGRREQCQPQQFIDGRLMQPLLTGTIRPAFHNAFVNEPLPMECPRQCREDTAIPLQSPRTRRKGGGMYLEVAPSGGKWWWLKYRFGGKEKRISLGTYPEVSLKEVREKREIARKQLAATMDPGENRKATRAARAADNANTFEVVAREWFDTGIQERAKQSVAKMKPLHCGGGFICSLPVRS